MIPHDPARPQIDPRRLVLEGSERDLYELICGAGYIPMNRISLISVRA